MSDSHLIRADNHSGSGSNDFTAVYHLPVDESTMVKRGVTLRQAIAADGPHPSQLGNDIELDEQTKLDAGELIEVVEEISISENAPPGETEQRLDDRWNELDGVEQVKVRERYEWGGFKRNVGDPIISILLLITLAVSLLFGSAQAQAADYHVLDGSQDGKSFRVVYHIPIPDVNNEAGVSYRTALSEWLQSQDTPDVDASKSAVPNLPAAEQTQLDNGELFEVVERFKTHPSHTPLENRNRMDARFNELITIARNRLQRRLKYWGLNRNVP